MPTVTDETDNRLLSHAALLGTTPDAVALPALERAATISERSHTPTLPERPPLTGDAWARKFDACNRAVQAEASRYPDGFRVHVSRERQGVAGHRRRPAVGPVPQPPEDGRLAVPMCGLCRRHVPPLSLSIPSVPRIGCGTKSPVAATARTAQRRQPRGLCSARGQNLIPVAFVPRFVVR